MISINPNIQTTALGSFNIESDGVITGTAWPDPSARYALSGGILAADEPLPLWGGVAVEEFVAAFAADLPRPELGGTIRRAADEATHTGFSVFDQNYAAINTPQSPVPQTAPGGFVAFYRFGCGIRIAVPLDPALVVDTTMAINQGWAWDYANQRLIAGADIRIRVLRVWPGNCMVPVYDGGPAAVPPAPGFLTWDRNAAAAVILL
jgi:hypothetical protein